VVTAFSLRAMLMETTPPVKYSKEDTINLENIDTYIVKNPHISFHKVLIPECTSLHSLLRNGRIVA
jgi:hypothetical protein